MCAFVDLFRYESRVSQNPIRWVLTFYPKDILGESCCSFSSTFIELLTLIGVFSPAIGRKEYHCTPKMRKGPALEFVFCAHESSEQSRFNDAKNAEMRTHFFFAALCVASRWISR
jgi:hypothetical protein